MIQEPSFGLDAHLSTLVDLLRWRVQHQPDQRIYTFLVDGATEEVSLTYAELDRRAQAIAMHIRDLAAVGERALLLYPPGLDYIAAFFGCLYAGVVAVPAYPPDPARLTRTLPRLNAIVQDAEPTLTLTTTPIMALSEALSAHAPDRHALRWLATDMLVPGSEAEWLAPELSGATMALLQYTSGSTAAPKGVMLSHSNLLHNSALIARGFGHTSESRGVIWLPPYHDMGLIGGILQPLYANFPVTLMSPLDFLQRPVGWLQAITRYGATTSGGPNFAYDLCVRKVTPEQRASLDLSSWTVAFNGAEPVRSETLERFAATFAPCGFRRAAFYSCYGLAEATLIVTGGSVDVPPIHHTFAGDALEQNSVVVAPTEVDGARTLVSVGRCLPDQQIVIVDSDCGRLCSPDRVGEIWVAGPGVALGYWNRSVETQQTFRAALADTGAGPFLRTGDLGFVCDGELFVTGRLKDLIIIRGRNHYPQDIEMTVERSHAALRPGASAAFAVEIAGEERLVVVQEIARRARQVPIAEVARAIRQAVAAAHEVPVYAVALLKPGSIPKTASGKIQRHACRLSFLAGTLEEVGRSLLDEQATVADAVVDADVPELNGSVLRELNVADQTAVLATYMRRRVARVLGVAPDHLDPQQPLSALGLDSLLAIELQHTIEAEINIVVSMVDMLQGASVAQLADQARAALASALPPSSPLPVAEQASTAAHPLSHGQRALWFLHQLAPESAAYHIASAMCIHGTLNVSALRHAFQALIDHHPALRTTFVASDGEPTQQVHPHVEVGFVVEDATTWPTATLDARLAAAAYRPFDLAHGPLLRVYLFKRAPRQHLLLLVVHHLVADLWSLALLVHELGQHYAATLAAGPPPAWPPAPSYTAFVHWQRDHLAGAVGAQLTAYWRAQLAAMPTRLALPTDRPRPPIQTYRGAAHVARLDEAVTARLRGLARAAGTTLYTLLLAAFEVLLYRYSGQERLVLGTPTSGRSRAEWAGAVGYFVNTVALRAELGGNPPFAALLTQTQAIVLGALAHQDYPFALLVEQLQPERDASRAPLVQVMFALQKAQPRDGADVSAFALGEAGARLAVGPLVVESLALAQRIAHFDLSVLAAEMDGGLAASWQYNADLFDAATIARMARHFRALLTSIDIDPAWPVADLPLLTVEERQQMLVEWNATAAEYPRDQSLAAAFEAQVDRRPDAVALIFDLRDTETRRPGDQETGRHGDQETRGRTTNDGSAFSVQRSAFSARYLTYSELNRRANQLAHYLRALGVGPEVLVGICMEAAPELLVGVLGILKAGGAYVPLDPAHPPARLAFMLADAQVAVLLTRTNLQDKETSRQADKELINLLVSLSPSLDRVVDLSADWPRIAQECATYPAPAAIVNRQSKIVNADNLAYVLYTSGSTGQPKGTMITQRSVRNYVRWVVEELLGDTVAYLPMVTRLSFDASLKQFFAPLLHGGPVWMLPSEVVQDAARLVQTLRTRPGIGLNCIPALWKAILTVIESEPAGAPTVRLVDLFLGGDQFDAGLVVRSLAALPHLRIWNLYGPTEATANASMASVTPGAHPTIGHPIANTQMYLLDARLQPVPIGIPGELYIGGIGLARGYLGRPDLTAERFVPNPFATTNAVQTQNIASLPPWQYIAANPQSAICNLQSAIDTRLHRTGDLARWRPDGNLEFLGRIDAQVKLRGYRIELGEIESVLLQHPAVRDTAVLARMDVPGDLRLVAYVVPTKDERRKTKEEERDPSFVLRPSSFVQELRAFLQTHLPDYMVPAAFVTLEVLPLTTSGKLDRQALPEPEPGRMALEEDQSAARTPIEELVAEIWASVLGVERVGIDDNFFEWGGHSLLAIQVIGRVQESVGVELPVSALFEAPTVRGMAEEVERRLLIEHGALVPALVRHKPG